MAVLRTGLVLGIVVLAFSLFQACEVNDTEEESTNQSEPTESTKDNPEPISYVSRGEEVDYRTDSVTGSHTVFMYTADW